MNWRSWLRHVEAFSFMNVLKASSAVSSGIICGGLLKAYAQSGISAPLCFLFRAIFVALTTSSSTLPAFGASMVLNLRSICIGALQKYVPLIQK